MQQDPVAVGKWLEETYPQIEQRAKAENALILWQDETAVKQDSNWVRSYAPRGQTPVLIENARTNYGSSSKALFNFALRELLSITQAKFLCKRLFRVLLKSFLNWTGLPCLLPARTAWAQIAGKLRNLRSHGAQLRVNPNESVQGACDPLGT